MSERIFNFSNIFKDYSEYEETKNEIKNLILSSFESRNKPARIILGSDVITATLGRVLINLLIMKPFVGKGLKLTSNDMFGFESVTEWNLDSYFNYILKRFKEDDKDLNFEELRKIVGETINEMSDISGDLNVLAGNSISFYDFVRLSSSDPEAKDMFNQKIDKRMQFDEIEKKFGDLGDRIENYFKTNMDTELYPFVISDTGINKKQFTQAVGFVGLKPDIDGTIIPVAIEDNYLTGLKNLENYFINSKGTRKALITNSRMVRRSGYLTRKLSLAMIDRYHDNNIEDCGTKHFVKFEISNEKKLEQIEGRHYYELSESGMKEKEINTVLFSDKNLIGKTIALRSPVTCAAKHVCKTCYGSDLSEINKNLNTGLISVLLLTNPLTQKLLSAKHLLTTKAEKVDWQQGFLEYFSVNMNSIYFADAEVSISFSSKLEKDEEEEIEYIKEFEIYVGNKKMMSYSSDIRFIVDMKFFKEKEIEFNQETERYTLLARNFSYEEPVFTFVARNNELTKSLEQIVELIETTEHLGETTYHGIVNRFSDLIIENDLGMNSVHAEMIVSRLVVEKDKTTRLNFMKKDIDSYDILRVSNVVMNGPLSVSLAFERLDEQLVDLDTYEKDGQSLMDYLYR
jgi:hypothetical protein